MSMDFLRLEDLYINNPNDQLYIYPFFSEDSDKKQINAMEYCLGLQLGELNLSNKSCPVPRRVRLRSEMILALQRHEWALLPDKETLELVAKNLMENGKRPTDTRRKWETVYPLQSEYTYTLFFKDALSINSAGGPCKSGETLIRCAVHPALTITSATRYTLDEVSKDNIPELLSPLLSCNRIFFKTLLQRSFLDQDPTLDCPNPFQALDDVEAGTPENPVFCYVEYVD